MFPYFPFNLIYEQHGDTVVIVAVSHHGAVHVIGWIVATRKARTQSVDPYNKGIELLARREHSARELKSKLARRGIEKDEVDSVVSTLQSKDFQNDARFGEMLVRTRIESGYGPRWIVAELQTHGIAEAQGARTDRCRRAGLAVDRAQPAAPPLRRKPPANLAERVKRANFLLRRGFDAATVQSVDPC